jgi:hypothetical protein
MNTWPKQMFRDRTVSKAREFGVGLNFTVGDTRVVATCISCFPCQITTRNFLRFSAPPRIFFSHAPCLQAASLREILHMQAGHCGNPIGTKF